MEKKELLNKEEQSKVTGGSDDNSFKEGTAGAYGCSGSSGSTVTATGDIINDSSLGVAIPVSWPNYHSYFGKTVLIRYGETVVLAKINDCGFLNGRDLDLQPGVIKSFGFSSCYEWGVRSISYCIQ